jgi:hypothetical protein
MKSLSLLAILSILSFFTTVKASTTYNFAVTNINEKGWESYIDGDLTVTASNGNGINATGVPTNSDDRYYAYLDGPSGSTNVGGLGVCKKTDGNCAGISDDNQMSGEYIHMRWSNEVNIWSLNIQGDHGETIEGTNLKYSLDLGATWYLLDIALKTLEDVPTAGWVSNSLDYTIVGNENTDPQMYLASITVSAVPVPAAIWLFGTALIGFVGMSRRTSV